MQNNFLNSIIKETGNKYAAIASDGIDGLIQAVILLTPYFLVLCLVVYLIIKLPL